jgi:hypothetical protein
VDHGSYSQHLIFFIARLHYSMLKRLSRDRDSWLIVSSVNYEKMKCCEYDPNGLATRVTNIANSYQPSIIIEDKDRGTVKTHSSAKISQY